MPLFHFSFSLWHLKLALVFVSIKCVITHNRISDSVVDSNSRRKLSPEPENNECRSPRRSDDNLMILDDLKSKKAAGKCVGSRKKDCCNQDYLNACDQICRMVEAEIPESNWLPRGNILKHQDCEDIFADFESQILEQLLHELVLLT